MEKRHCDLHLNLPAIPVEESVCEQKYRAAARDAAADHWKVQCLQSNVLSFAKQTLSHMPAMSSGKALQCKEA
jgi:hypothetical protein